MTIPDDRLWREASPEQRRRSLQGLFERLREERGTELEPWQQRLVNSLYVQHPSLYEHPEAQLGRRLTGQHGWPASFADLARSYRLGATASRAAGGFEQAAAQIAAAMNVSTEEAGRRLRELWLNTPYRLEDAAARLIRDAVQPSQEIVTNRPQTWGDADGQQILEDIQRTVRELQQQGYENFAEANNRDETLRELAAAAGSHYAGSAVDVEGLSEHGRELYEQYVQWAARPPEPIRHVHAMARFVGGPADGTTATVTGDPDVLFYAPDHPEPLDPSICEPTTMYRRVNQGIADRIYSVGPRCWVYIAPNIEYALLSYREYITDEFAERAQPGVVGLVIRRAQERFQHDVEHTQQRIPPLSPIGVWSEDRRDEERCQKVYTFRALWLAEATEETTDNTNAVLRAIGRTGEAAAGERFGHRFIGNTFGDEERRDRANRQAARRDAQDNATRLAGTERMLANIDAGIEAWQREESYAVYVGVDETTGYGHPMADQTGPRDPDEPWPFGSF